ncbi:unnamed protein product [Lactuca saligna]|uniref:DUF4283 domain-containing protein n=1 Tax=Lactuca saligna TaxID=75948 RepID=A0AA35YWT0_LACSI|nr:unnamed protein product [Lactuca saligna]
MIKEAFQIYGKVVDIYIGEVTRRSLLPHNILLSRLSCSICCGQGFAEAVTGKINGNIMTNPHPTITLKPIEIVSKWEERVLVGEVCSAQHIANIPTIMERDSNYSGKVYYIGGLKIIIVFINQKEADMFYQDDSNWNRWFKWLKKGFNDDHGATRLAWVRIHGVPVRFRSEENYTKIAENFGKPIETFGGNWKFF